MHTLNRFRTVDIVMSLLGLALLLLIVGGSILVYREQSSQRSARETAELMIERLKAREMPIDIIALQDRYIAKTHAEDNTAWSDVITFLQENKLPELYSEAVGQGLKKVGDTEPLDLLKLQRELVQRFQPSLAQIHSLAAKRKSIRFNYNYKDSESLPIGDARVIHRLLTSEATVHLADQNSMLLRQSLQTQLNLHYIFQGFDLRICGEVDAAMHEVTLSSVRTAIEANVLNDEDLTLILDDLRSYPDAKQNWQQMVQVERGLNLPRLTGQTACLVAGVESVIQLNGKELLTYLAFMNSVENVNWSNWETAKTELRAISSDFKEKIATTQLEDKIVDRKFLDRLQKGKTSVFISDWPALGEVLAQADNARNQTILGCALRLYQSKHGQFPDHLDKLKDVGVDPSKYLSLADIPFGYELQNGTAYLWGPLQDQGGNSLLEIEPSPPLPTARMTKEETERIKNALIILAP